MRSLDKGYGFLLCPKWYNGIMLKKIFAGAFLLVFLLGVLGIWGVYHVYSNRKAEARARLAQKAAETSATVIEGWNVDEIAAYYEKLGLFPKSEFIKATQDFDTKNFPLVDRTNSKSLEGYLFPDTYRFAKDATPNDVITKMLTDFSSRVTDLGVEDANTKYNGLSLYEIITLASIIEKESGGDGATTGALSLQDERDLVASVFYNRMAIGQALESDATINYITGKDTPAASASDLAVNSPYNTYKHAGLPPGPICNPSLGSIKAALFPAKSDYYYFLHKQPSGQVDFSRTFEEHKSKK
jgi:UPF0755 protein